MAQAFFENRQDAVDHARARSRESAQYFRVLRDEDGFLIFKGRGKPQLEGRPVALFFNGQSVEP